MRDGLEEVRAAALAELRRQPVAAPWWRDALVLVGVNTAITVAAMLTLSVASQQHGSEVLRWSGAALLATLGLVGGVLSLRPGGRTAQWVMVGVGVACMGVLVAAVSGSGPGRSFFGGFGCGLSEVVLSLVPAVVTALMLARFAFEPLRAVVGGLSAGAGGVLVLNEHCPNGEGLHVLAFHLLPWVAVAVVLVLMRARMRSRSFAP